MADIRELTKQFQRDKLRRTMLEMERVGREAQGRQGGIDPFTAEELGKRASPYYRTRAEIDQDIASINALAAEYAAAQKALLSAKTSGEKADAQQRLDWAIKKKESAAEGQRLKYGTKAEEALRTFDAGRENYEKFVEGDDKNRLSPADVASLQANPQQQMLSSGAGAFTKLIGALPQLPAAEAKNLIEDYAGAANVTPEQFRKELSDMAVRDDEDGHLRRLNKIVQDVDAQHAALVEKYSSPEELQKDLANTLERTSAGVDWGEYPGADAAGGMTPEEWAQRSAMARAEGPFDQYRQQLAEEIMAEDAPETPYRDAWEEYTSTPEFTKEAEDLWGKKGPFTEAEARVVFRKLKQRGRQEAGAARKEGRGLELGGRASAEAAMPAAAAETETPVTEAPEETVPVTEAPEAAETLISLKGDSYEYKFGETDASIRSPGGEWRPMSDEEIEVVFRNMKAAPEEVTVTGAPLPEGIAAATGVVSVLPEAPMAEIPARLPGTPVPPTVADLARQSITERYDTSWMSKPLGVDEVEMLPEEEEQVAVDVAKMPEPVPEQLPPGDLPGAPGQTPGRATGQQAWQQATRGLVPQERVNRAALRNFGR